MERAEEGEGREGMSHTLGPWRTCKAKVGPDHLVYSVESGGAVHIAEVFGYQNGNNPEGPAEDNARLVAAAPEMLELLKAYVELIGADSGEPDAPVFYGDVEKVLAKVKGGRA